MESVRSSRFDSASHPQRRAPTAASSTLARRCRAKFLRYYPKGFIDADYVDLERGYKWAAHKRWKAELSRPILEELLNSKRYVEIAARAVAIESRTNLLFSFEKMALRDGIKSPGGARTFSEGLYALLYGTETLEARFNRWIEAVGSLPRRQTRVLTWPVLTVMGFLAQPSMHMYLKPTVTKKAVARYGFDFQYESRPSWDTYSSLLKFARSVRRDLHDMHPRDMIDIQSFLGCRGQTNTLTDGVTAALDAAPDRPTKQCIVVAKPVGCGRAWAGIGVRSSVKTPQPENRVVVSR